MKVACEQALTRLDSFDRMSFPTRGKTRWDMVGHWVDSRFSVAFPSNQFASCFDPFRLPYPNVVLRISCVLYCLDTSTVSLA